MKSRHLSLQILDRYPVRLLLLVAVFLLPQVTPATTNALPEPLVLPADFDALRDPLLPPGFAQVDDAEHAEQERLRQEAALAERIQWPTLKLRGITHAGRRSFIAVLEEIGIVEEGDEIRMRRDDFIYTWRVDSISENGITTTRLHVVAAQAPMQALQQPHQTAPGTAPPPPPPGLPLPFP